MLTLASYFRPEEDQRASGQIKCRQGSNLFKAGIGELPLSHDIFRISSYSSDSYNAVAHECSVVWK